MRAFLSKIYSGLNLWNKLILTANLIFAFFLLLSFLAPIVSPADFLYIAYFGLLYPFWLIINICFLVYWAIQKKWIFTISLFIIILGILPLSRFWQITLFPNLLEESESFKVMSFNVRLFDLYNWTNNKESKNNIVLFLENEKPDVICFQEYYRGEGVHFSVRDTLKTLLDLKYVFEYTPSVVKQKKGKNYFGSAIFSKYPIINSGSQSFVDAKGNHFSWVDILKNDDTIRVFNAHIGSLHLQNADYQFIGGDDNKKWPYEKPSEQNFIKRMNAAFLKRVDQTAQLKNAIDSCGLPIILCTDLNDTPNSYAYHTLVKGLKDGFVKAGSGIGSTYIGDNVFNRIFPINRIDYILFSDDFKSANFITHQEKLSDHKAISVELQLIKD